MRTTKPFLSLDIKASFVLELFLLLLAAPFLYLPERFPSWASALALLLTASTWVWRRWRLHQWLQRSPAEWPLFFLFAIMLPVAVAVAPAPLRQLYAIPKALILLWNFCLFWTIVTYSSQNAAIYRFCVIGFLLGGLMVAGLALLGTQWQNKLFGLNELLYRFPRPLEKMFKGASEGFNPNQVAGTLLYMLPLQIALLVYEIVYKRRWLLLGLGSAGFLVTGFVFAAAQSRGALVGLTASLVLMGLLPYRKGRWLLLGLIVLVLMTLPFLPIAQWLANADQSTTIQLTPGVTSFATRKEIWLRALYGIQDFPFTGMGLGTFRLIVHQFYPTVLLPNNFDFGHAHNFFLQTALDFGLPGLISLVAFYILAIFLSVSIIFYSTCLIYRVYAIGLLGAILAQSLFSFIDAVAMGSKTNFMLWFLFALVFSLNELELNGRVLYLRIINEQNKPHWSKSLEESPNTLTDDRRNSS